MVWILQDSTEQKPCLFLGRTDTGAEGPGVSRDSHDPPTKSTDLDQDKYMPRSSKLWLQKRTIRPSNVSAQAPPRPANATNASSSSA